MALVEIGSQDIDAVRAAAQAEHADPATAYQLGDLLVRMRFARDIEVAEAIVEELTERRGRLRVVGE